MKSVGKKKKPHASRSRVHEINDHRSGVPCQREFRVGVLVLLLREKTRRWRIMRENRFASGRYCIVFSIIDANGISQ
jgi:hypothetical protein